MYLNKEPDIMAATIDLFHDHGDNISLGDVAMHVGCSKTLIIHYFGSRKELLSRCFDSICREMKENFDRTPIPDDHSREAMREYFSRLWRAYFQYLRDNPTKAHFFIQYSHGHHPLPSRYKAPGRILAEMLGDRYGKIATDDPELYFVMTYSLAVANGMSSLVFSNHLREEEEEDLIERCLNLMMNGIVRESRET